MAAMNAQIINSASDKLVAQLELGTPKVNSAGGKTIAVNNAATHKSVRIKLPIMKCWGIDNKEYDGKSKYSMSVAFPMDKYVTPETTASLENFKQFDDYIKNQAIANSKDWFNKAKMSMEVVEAIYTPTLKYSKTEDGEYNMTKPPNFNVKVPFWDGRCDTEIYAFDGKLLFPNAATTVCEVVPKGAMVASLIECGGIWFAGGKFGVTWKVKQVCIQLNDYLPRGVCLISSKEKEGAEALPTPPTLTRSETVFVKEDDTEVGIQVADSDDERDPETEYNAGEPAPSKGRKRVVKKAA